jgi:type I restriction enzyme S subunit
MNAERLLKHYEKIADAPDAIPRLRRFVLDLAVRGKLVPQDPNDEPASELLKRIAVEKARLVKAGKIRKSLALEPITDAEAFHELPRTWAWVRVGDIFDYDAGTKRDPKELDQSRWLLELEDIEKDTSRIVERLRVSDRDSRSTKSQFEPGDILYGKLRPYLNKVVVADEPGYSTPEIVAIRPFMPLCPEYCALAFRRPDFVASVERLGRGTKMPRLRTPDAIVAPFPLPPLAEQHRIVAKVDELMGLCDRLEAARAAREATRDKLTAASLARLNAPDPDTFREDARFALDALPALTARADQIKQLRQTILNLAVRGKLVPQDPNDETAQDFLETIAAYKEQSGNGRARRKAERIQVLANQDVPFGLPSGWVWNAFGDIVVSRDGERIPVSKEDRNRREKLFDYYGASGVIDKIDNYLFDKPLLLIGEDGANLINRSTPIAFIARGKYWVNNHAHVLDGPSEEFLRYLELFINAIDLKPYVTGTAQPKLNQAKMNSIPVALPPLAEQRRIVAKVDELMALCDRLEASLATADDTRRRLLEALLAEALAPDAERELEAAE